MSDQLGALLAMLAFGFVLGAAARDQLARWNKRRRY